MLNLFRQNSKEPSELNQSSIVEESTVLDDRAFKVHEKERLHSTYQGMAIALFFAFLFMATFGKAAQPEDLPWFRFWQAMMAMGAGGMFLLFRLWPVTRKYPFIIGALGASLVAGMAGYHLGAKGGFDTPWFYASYMLPYTFIVLPCPLIVRIPFTLSMTIPFLLLYLGPHPEYLQYDLRGVPLNYLLIMHIISVIVGHKNYVNFKKAFMAHLKLAQKERSLVTLNDELNGIVLAKTRTLRELLSHLDDVQEEERRHLAAELHDDFGQLLLCLRLESGALQNDPQAMKMPNVKLAFAAIESIADELQGKTRRIIAELRPPTLDELGAAAAIRQLAENLSKRAQFLIECDFCKDTDALLHGPQSSLPLTVFRLVQEALSNCIRHSEAEHVKVRIWQEKERILIEICDNGKGFDVNTPRPGHWGLTGMQERLRATGGTLVVTSIPGETCVLAAIPLDAAAV